jgi:hypothetical protein
MNSANFAFTEFSEVGIAAVQCLGASRTGHTGCFSTCRTGAMGLLLEKISLDRTSNWNDLCVDTSVMVRK